MRLGLLADTHEHVDHLAAALARFARESVDQVVLLGDTFDTGGRLDEIIELLEPWCPIGVWGNHDIGLSHEPPESVAARISDRAREFLSTIQPRISVAGCLFQHVEPWLDARRVEDLWYFDGPPDTVEKAARSFAAASERVPLVGHFHR